MPKRSKDERGRVAFSPSPKKQKTDSLVDSPAVLEQEEFLATNNSHNNSPIDHNSADLVEANSNCPQSGIISNEQQLQTILIKYGFSEDRAKRKVTQYWSLLDDLDLLEKDLIRTKIQKIDNLEQWLLGRKIPDLLWHAVSDWARDDTSLILENVKSRRYTFQSNPISHEFPPVLCDRTDAKRDISYFIERTFTGAIVSDGKYPLLGTYGVKGIGKTEILTRTGTEWIKELNLPISPHYITFNGRSLAKAINFKNPSTLVLEFLKVALEVAGVERSLLTTMNIGDHWNILCNMAKENNHQRILFLVDEIIELDKWPDCCSSTELISNMVQFQDNCQTECKPIFIFSSILDSLLIKAVTGSARRVRAIPLPSISKENIWQVIPPGVSALLQRGESVQKTVYQFLIDCCGGHPRSLVDGLAELHSLKTPLDRIANNINRYIDLLIEVSKFNLEDGKEKLHKVIFGALEKLLLGKSVSTKTMVRLTQAGVWLDNRILPIYLRYWVRIIASHKIAPGSVKQFCIYLAACFEADLAARSDAEKELEGLIYNFEAAKRFLFTYNSDKKSEKRQKTTLKSFYKTNYFGVEDSIVWISKFPGITLVESFTKDMSLVVDRLQEGCIVVSKLQNEPAIEYLSPFFDENGKLIIVACVQVKMRETIRWKKITSYIQETAICKHLNEKKITTIPIIFATTSREPQRNSYPNSICYNREQLENCWFNRITPLISLHIKQKKNGAPKEATS